MNTGPRRIYTVRLFGTGWGEVVWNTEHTLNNVYNWTQKLRRLLSRSPCVMSSRIYSQQTIEQSYIKLNNEHRTKNKDRVQLFVVGCQKNNCYLASCLHPGRASIILYSNLLHLHVHTTCTSSYVQIIYTTSHVCMQWYLVSTYFAWVRLVQPCRYTEERLAGRVCISSGQPLFCQDDLIF